MKKKTLKKFQRVYNQACDLIDAMKYNEALHLFTLSAQRGHRPSMLRLGIMYYWGRGIEPNASKALHWLRLAADKGSSAACLNYAHVCYAYATFIKEKESLMNEQAWKYYSKAARKDGRYYFYLGLMCYEGKFCIDKEREHHIKASMLFFAEALSRGDAESALYLWYISTTRGKTIEEYYDEGERLLELHGKAKDYNNWAYTLCTWGEYKKALLYIEACLAMEDNVMKNPNYLDTYGECLYGLGRMDEAKKVFIECLNMYRQRDERRRIYETEENIRQKFYCLYS